MAYTLVSARANGHLVRPRRRELAPVNRGAGCGCAFKDGERNAIIDGAPGKRLSRTGGGDTGQGDLSSKLAAAAR